MRLHGLEEALFGLTGRIALCSPRRVEIALATTVVELAVFTPATKRWKLNVLDLAMPARRT